MTHLEYSPKKSSKFDILRPQDSSILYGDGKFRSESQTAAEFTHKKGERANVIIRNNEEFWKVCRE